MKAEQKSKTGKAGLKRPAFLLLPDFSLERSYLEKGYEVIAGIDEAGRGALAGPLAVGLSIFPRDFIENPDKEILCVNDSKKLSPKKRQIAVNVIKKHSIHHDVVFISPEAIDRFNINGATERAVRSLIERLPVTPDILLIDGRFRFSLSRPYASVIRGDSLSLSIASASILAKVARDEELRLQEKSFPGYGFHENKGYGTRFHLEALKELGCCPIHRKSYEPVKSMNQP